MLRRGMNYLDFKKLQKQVIESGNTYAILYLMENGSRLISSRLQSYKYTHSDLNSDDRKILLELNNLHEDDILIGGEVNIESKQLIQTKVDEIELFTIMEQINWIISNRKEKEEIEKAGLTKCPRKHN